MMGLSLRMRSSSGLLRLAADLPYAGTVLGVGMLQRTGKSLCTPSPQVGD